MKEKSMPRKSIKKLLHDARVAQTHWRTVSVEERARILSRSAETLRDRMEEVAELIVQENGKPQVEAIGHEITPAIANIRYLCKQAPAVFTPESVSLAWLPHRKARLVRVPFGVVLVISPWNIPLNIPLGQVIAALIAGNAVILKPSEVTPRVGALISELLAIPELPSGLFQIVQGDGKTGAQLIRARPDRILFTGSVATGRKVMAAAAKHPIPVTLELGGIDAMIVCEDADLEYASSAAAWGGTFNGGQVCASVERLLVHEAIEEAFLNRLVDKMNQIRPSVGLGPITFAAQRQVYDRHLSEARQEGLTFRCGGDYLDEKTLSPTLICGAEIERASVYREESFGPIIAARTFKDDDEAIALHNDTLFGLTASVFSRSNKRANKIAGQVRAGLVSINDIAGTLYSQPELPWGGVGHSGFGRSHGHEGLLETTWTQVIEESRAPNVEIKRPWWYPYNHQLEEIMRLFGKAAGESSKLKQAGLLAKLGRHVASMLTQNPRI